MKTEKKLSKIINSEKIKQLNVLTDERELLLLDILLMVQTLNKDCKLKDLAKVISNSFPEYGKLI